MTQWVLLLMISLQPANVTPWADTFPATAESIARASVQSPLFAGADGPARTATVLVSVAWFEGRFNAHAIGDHGHSHGMFQSSRVPIEDLDEQTRQALGMMRASFAGCHARKAEDWLGHYASGGSTCTNVGGLIASRHRMSLAMRLWKDHPSRQIDPFCTVHLHHP